VDFEKSATGVDKLNEEKIREFLENLSPEDFGKYKM
jgi:hypothetical protein